MSFTPYPFTFGFLGSSIDSLISEMEERAHAMIPTQDYLRSTMKNAVPRMTGSFNVDVTEVEDNLIVTCDLPGFNKSDVSVKLVNPETIVIKTEKYESCDSDKYNADSFEREKPVYHLRERRIGSGQRTIFLPRAVTNEGAKATFRNGILELILPKIKLEEGEEIFVE